MTISRNWQLQQLGITQWILRHPMILQNNIMIKLPDQIRLLLVAELPPAVDHPLIVDVARSMALTSAQLYGITPKQAIMLPDNIHFHCWWIGIKAQRNFSGITFYTPPLVEFSQNASAKRELWYQISNNKHHITISTN